MTGFLKRALALLLAFSLLFLLAACKKTEPIALGCAYPSLNEVARVPWDLCLFDGKLYVGAGDYGRNIPPKEFMCYDTKTGAFQSVGACDDEQINRFLVLDGKLYAPGTDPRSSWDYGTYYRLEDGVFIEHFAIPDGVHTFDMCHYDGKLFAVIGTYLDTYPVQMSRDGGESFETVMLMRDGESVPPAKASEDEVNRCYNLFPLSNGLFLFYLGSLYRYDAESETFLFEKEYRSYYLDKDTYVPILSDCEFGGKFFFTTMFLYRAELEEKTLSAPVEITLPDSEKISDLLVWEDTMYLLTLRKWGLSYTVKVYQTKDGENFDEAFAFSYPVPAMSFAYDGKQFYFGMGEINAKQAENGTILSYYYEESDTE